MKQDTGTLNELWCSLIIKELVHHGVRTFCIAPGSRSTPLTIAAASHPLAETQVHYDERGLGFYALGLAKGIGQPAALIVTSGTAVGNLLPAIMEAHHDHVPLIVLTADRPPELHDCGANQTTHQRGIYQNFVRFQGEIPCPDSKISQNFIGRFIAQGISKALSEPRGPVHFNCLFRKPLHEMENSTSFSSHQSRRTDIIFSTPILDEKKITEIADELSEYDKGVILVSGTASLSDIEDLYTLSRHLQWPIFPDILSTARSHGNGYGVIPYYDLIIKSIGAHEDYAPDAVLQLGDRFVSSKLSDWISSKKPKAHYHIAPHPIAKDETLSVTHRVISDLDHFIKHFSSHTSTRSPSKWFEIWNDLNQFTGKGVDAYFKKYSHLSESYLFHTLADFLPPNHSLFLANSMPIRNGEAFFTPKSSHSLIYGNRGLSGIDGNIATLAGIAKGSGKPLVGIIGDLTCLHDLNSLPLIKNLPIKLIVINNNGGDIFTFLPIHERQDLFTSYFTTPHDITLEKGASLFDIPYVNPQNLEELKESLSSPGAALIEVTTIPGENLTIHKDIVMNLKGIHSHIATSV